MNEEESASAAAGGAATNRDEMLVQFHSITGLDNLEECESMLESAGWDLNQAIQLFYANNGLDEVEHLTSDEFVVRPKSQVFTVPSGDLFEKRSTERQFTVTGTGIGTGAGTKSNEAKFTFTHNELVGDDDDDDNDDIIDITSSEPSKKKLPQPLSALSGDDVPFVFGATKRLLTFNIDYKSKKFTLHLQDHETVRALKEHIADNLQIPIDKFSLKGWKDREHRATDGAVLRDLSLKRETSLFVVNADNYEAAQVSTVNEKDVSFELIIFILDTSNLSTISSQSSSYRLKFDGATKFLDVKRAIAKLTHIVVFNQEWWSFAKNHLPDEFRSLADYLSSVSESEPSARRHLNDDTITSKPSNKSANERCFQEMLINNILYTMPLSCLEPDNLSLIKLRELITNVLDPDNGAVKTATSWSNEASKQTDNTYTSLATASAVTDFGDSGDKYLSSKNSKLVKVKSTEHKMAFVVTVKNGNGGVSMSSQTAATATTSSRAADVIFESETTTTTTTTTTTKNHHIPLGFDIYLPEKKTKTIEEKDYDDSIVDEDHMVVDDDDDDDDLDDQLLLDATVKKKPLIADDCPDDEYMATMSFTDEFATRYGPIVPLFFVGQLEDAIKEALLCSAKDRKLLGIYLHNDSTVFSNIFCSKTLCDENIVNFLATNFTVWPWDLTTKKRERHFYDSCSKHLGTTFASEISSSKKLPVLVIVTRVRANNEVLGVIEGDATAEHMLDRLMQYFEMFDAQRAKDERDEKLRDERERIKREQDAAYQASLESDKVKRQKQTEENEKQRRAEELERKRREEKENYQKECLKNLPEEPADDSTAKVSRIRFRLPNGETLQRKFLITSTLKQIVDFAIGHAYWPEEYKILSSWPRKDLTAEPMEKTLEEMKLYPQETLTLEQRFNV